MGHVYNKIKVTNELLPDAPEGQWDMTIVRGKSKISPTKDGDPMVTCSVRLDNADDPANDSYAGTLLSARFIFFPPVGGKVPTFAKNRTIKERQDAAAAMGFDLDVIPEELNDPESDLIPFIEAIEGKTFTGWTQHEPNRKTGEIMTRVCFSEPTARAGGTTSAATAGRREVDDEPAEEKLAAKKVKKLKTK